jgi:uncharacterized OB-fold protein
MEADVCDVCGTTWVAPATRCASCGSASLHRSALNSAATVRAFTTVHSDARTPTPWGLAQVETDDGIVLIGPVDGPLLIGDRAVIARCENGVPIFVRMGQSA